MTLEAAHDNWAVQDFSEENEETVPDSVKNAAINDMGLNYETYESLTNEWPNSTFVLTTPAGETASSTEELEALFKTVVDKKMTTFHRIQNAIEPRETNEQGVYESAVDEAEAESRRDLQGAGSFSVSYDFSDIGGWMGLSSVKSKHSNAKAGILLLSVCFKKNQNDAQISKRWVLWYYKFAILIKRCAILTSVHNQYKPKLFLIVGVSRGGTNPVGDLNGGYFKLVVLIGWLFPCAPAGFGVKIAAIITADWGPSGVDFSVSVKLTLSHDCIEALSYSVKRWVYSVLPYIMITGGVYTQKRIFEYTNMASDQFLIAKITCYLAIWAVIASVAIWLSGTITVMTKQSSTNHTKFAQKHLRKKSIYQWACCGMTYRQVYHLNFSANLLIKLKLLVFWFTLGDIDFDDGGWGRMGAGSIKNSASSGCADCHYYRKKKYTGRKGSSVWRKKYSCKGLAKSAKFLCAANLQTQASYNKSAPPSCHSGGCNFNDWCDNWGDDDGTDNDSSGHDGHFQCDRPAGP